MSLKWRPTLNYLGLMLATRVGPSLGQEPVATPPEQSEQPDFFLRILLLMATIFGWWLRGVLELKLQRIRAGSLEWLFRAGPIFRGAVASGNSRRSFVSLRESMTDGHGPQQRALKA